MFELDHRLRALQRQTREWAADFRALGPRLAVDPDLIRRYTNLPGVRFMSTLLIPPEYDPPVERIKGHRFTAMTAVERVVLMEEFACGDAAVLLACPGASMSGVLVDLLADTEQKRRYYHALLTAPTWTCFALTEPECGSDAAAMRTSLAQAPGGYLLTGTKRYIGNGARASLAVVFARSAPGPLGVSAVLLDTASPGFSAVPIESVGLRGLQLAALTMDAVPVPDNGLLGRHLSQTRRGMWACLRTFDRLRPAVAAVAVGVARAAYEYVLANRSRPDKAEQDRIDLMGARIEGVRELVRHAAAAVDRHPSGGYLASAAKASACRLAEEITVAACGFFGPTARLEHPALDRLVRDARGVEFMEGTRTMQKLHLYQGLLSGKLDRTDPLAVSA
ncbi:MAG TPA: acyl-CoA dehydrogenase family protein [Pseudonocardiaceae bacterium]|jgi:alkylation response protein AidB-like acyl-CoA dehydrogenase|nr:acyl-CoA dehydrogenase family protein [Pseudonocardiaceae bacterium]